MTEKNGQQQIEQDNAPQKSAEELEREQDQRDEEAGFAVGFAESRGTEPPAEAKKTFDEANAAAADAGKADKADKAGESTQSTQSTEATAAAAPAASAGASTAAPAKDEWEGVHPQVRKQLEAIQSSIGSVAQLAKSTAGRVGSMQSSLDAGRRAASAAGAEQPSAGEVAMAMADPAAWKAFEEEFPDFAKPVKAQFEAMHKELGKRPAQPAVDVNAITKQVVDSAAPSFQNAVAQAEERALTRLKHPDYRKTVNTPEFRTWFDGQPAEMKAKAESDAADDAISMLDAFSAHQTTQRQAVQTAADKKAKQQDRLRAAAAPSTTGAPARGAQTEAEAFAEGFNQVRGGRG